MPNLRKLTKPRAKSVVGGDTETPAGVFTTEFWLTVTGMVLICLLAIFDGLDVDVAAGAIAGGAGLYSVSRGLAKQ